MFVDPNATHNPSTGVAAPAAWGDAVRDALMALHGPPVVRLHLTGGGQSITPENVTLILFADAAGEDIDTHGMHSPTTNPGRLTVPTGWGGSWLVGATVQWQTNNTGTRRHAEILNGAGAKLVDADVGPSDSGYATTSLATIANAAAGEFFTLNVFHDADLNLLANADGFAGTIFWAAFRGSGAG